MEHLPVRDQIIDLNVLISAYVIFIYKVVLVDTFLFPQPFLISRPLFSVTRLFFEQVTSNTNFQVYFLPYANW